MFCAENNGPQGGASGGPMPGSGSLPFAKLRTVNSKDLTLAKRIYGLQSPLHGTLLACCAALVFLVGESRAAPPDKRDEALDAATIWSRAGDLRLLGNRAAVVKKLRETDETLRVRAAARARLLKRPLREVRPDGRVRELMRWEGESPLYYGTLNANAAISTGADRIRSVPHLADGAGWTVGVWDGGGIRTTHQELTGRVAIRDGASLIDHATHVGGTIAAAGVSPSARGMASAAHIDSYDWNSDASEMSSCGASYSGEPGKIALSNHSYAYVSGWDYTGLASPAWIWNGTGTTASGYEAEFGKYNTYVRDIDTLAYNLPYYLIFWAAGNDRSDNPSTGAKVALDPADPATVVTYDPALHPPGDGTYRGGYENISFNALAKNVVAIGAVNDAVTSGARDPAKATMTTFSSWGPINGLAAANLLAAMQTNPAVPRLIEQQLTTSVTTRSHPFTWDGVSPIRVTLCWIDPAGIATTAHDSRTPRLVNNLNLRVAGPAGSVHCPWIMPFVGTWTAASMSAAAATGTNNTDNVEQVQLAAPSAPGVYQAVVSFSGTLANSQQHYSLLISGAAPSAPNPQAVSPDTAEAGQINLAISGDSFAQGATVVFYRTGQEDVPAAVSGVTATTIACTLDTTAMIQGPWNLLVANPDGKTGTLQAALAVVTTLHSQSFDPAAPEWSATRTVGTGSPGWILTTSQSHSPPNAYFAPGPASKVTDNLISEPCVISGTAQRLRLHFWHTYSTESYDGCLLEVSKDNGATWYAINASGSGTSFVQGGYTTTIAGRGGSPNNRAELVGQPAWTGAGGSLFTEVIVALDTAVYGGATLRGRWRLSTDSSTASTGWTVDSVRITGYDTTNAAPIIVSHATADPASVTGNVVSLSVSAVDDAGMDALTYTWSVDASPEHPVSFSANGDNAARQTAATFSAPGGYRFLVTVMDAEGLTATSGVAVAVQATPTSIMVAPVAAEVETGRQQSFAAEIRDQFGGPLDPQPACSWSVDGGGAIDSNGLFTAGATAGGPYTVTAAALGLQGHAAVTVVDAPPVYWALGVEASPAEGGTVTGGGMYLDGAHTPLSAAPASGWRFRFWSGSGIADTNAPATSVAMDADKLVTAHFGPALPVQPQTTVILVR